MIIWVVLRYGVGYDQRLLRLRLTVQKRSRHHRFTILIDVCEANFMVRVSFNFRFWKLAVDSHSGFTRGSLPMSNVRHFSELMVDP